MRKHILLYALIAALVVINFTLWQKNQQKQPPQQDEIVQPANNTNKQTINTYQAHYMPVGNNDNFVEASEKSVNAVVHIKTKVRGKSYHQRDLFDLFFNPNYEPQHQDTERYAGAGSGVIISEDGYIVTNHHVIEKADIIEVTLNDKRSYTAQIIGSDPSSDLAVLKIEDDSPLPYLPFGNSDHTRVGEWVLAVGNPFNLTSTVTAGIVSAKARNMHVLDRGQGRAIESFIQTDAAINPGNSGGALVNMQGELIGINAAIASNTGSYAGYAFAIPSNLAQKVVGDLIQYGSAQRAYLGVSIAEITDELAQLLNIEDIKGVYVAGVLPNGAADKAGIKKGDVILQIEHQKVNTTSELIGKVAQYHPGEIINVEVKTPKGVKNYDVQLQNSEGNIQIQTTSTTENLIPRLGASFKTPSKELQNRLGVDYGMQISDIQKGIISRKGIKEGLLILKLNHEKIRTINDINNSIEQSQGGLLIEGIYPNGTHVYYGIGLE